MPLLTAGHTLGLELIFYQHQSIILFLILGKQALMLNQIIILFTKKRRLSIAVAMFNRLFFAFLY